MHLDARATPLDTPGKPEAATTRSASRSFSHNAAPPPKAAGVLEATASTKQQSVLGVAQCTSETEGVARRRRAALPPSMRRQVPPALTGASAFAWKEKSPSRNRVRRDAAARRCRGHPRRVHNPMVGLAWLLGASPDRCDQWMLSRVGLGSGVRSNSL
jgi:hypothetical protein